MFEWVALVAGLVVIGGALVRIIPRCTEFKWWLAVGYWFNAQVWGAREDTVTFVEPPSCWRRVLPAPICRRFASFFLMTVKPPPDGKGYPEALVRENHDMIELRKVIERWKRIGVRHEQRFWHPLCCRNPTNRQWCDAPDCDEAVTNGARVIRDRAYYYCPEHFPDPYGISDDG